MRKRGLTVAVGFPEEVLRYFLSVFFGSEFTKRCFVSLNDAHEKTCLHLENFGATKTTFP